jgi:hypothetical protein
VVGNRRADHTAADDHYIGTRWQCVGHEVKARS